MPVQFFSADVKLPLLSKGKLKTFIPKLCESEGKTFESLNYIFCSDDFLLDINKRFLNHDYYTDIITFDLSSGTTINGEIYISMDRVRDNATQLGQPLLTETLRVVFHGALHLCGYQDKSPEQKKVMRKTEEHYLGLFNKQ